MEGFILVLILNMSPNHAGSGGSHSTHVVEELAKCHKVGIKWVNAMNKVVAPDSTWHRRVVTTAEYRCLNLN